MACEAHESGVPYRMEASSAKPHVAWSNTWWNLSQVLSNFAYSPGLHHVNYAVGELRKMKIPVLDLADLVRDLEL